VSTTKLLRRKAASQYLHQTHGLERAPSTLAKLAVIGGGPVFRRVGRVPLYAPGDLDAWVASKLGPPMRSTSDAAVTVATLAGDPNGASASDHPANPLEREGQSRV
jgi:hypothetical protein